VTTTKTAVRLRAPFSVTRGRDPRVHPLTDRRVDPRDEADTRLEIAGAKVAIALNCFIM